jgi:hypothetical protein
MRNWQAMGVVLALSCSVAGCSINLTLPPEPEGPPTFDALATVSMKPEPGTMLRRGSSLDFASTVRYTLGTAHTGTLVLYAQNAAGEYYAIRRATVRGKGTGLASFDARIPIPERESMGVTVRFHTGAGMRDDLATGSMFSIE